jgi:lipid II:glycine glycyltransferase (peptidoglycan interpeptide bridge formation enzyme)
MGAFLDGLAAAPAFARIGAIRITPYWLDGDADKLTAHFAQSRWRLSDPVPFRETGLLDLDKSCDEMLESFSKSARREVRRAKRQEVEIRPIITLKDARVFFDSLNRLRSSRRLARIVPEEYEAAFPEIYADPSIGTILGAYIDGTFLSGLLLYRSRDVAFGHRFTTEPAALRALSNLRIAPLLWWSAMIWAKEQGCRHLDLEGYRDGLDETDPMYNVYKYKGEFNPRPARRFGEHSLVSNSLLNSLGAIPTHSKAALKYLLPGLVRIMRRRR